MPSIYEVITALIEKLRDITTNEEETSVVVVRSSLIGIMSELDDLRTRINEDMEKDQSRIVELENDVQKRDEEIRKLQADASKIVAKIGSLAVNEVGTTSRDENNEPFDWDRFIRKV